MPEQEGTDILDRLSGDLRFIIRFIVLKSNFESIILKASCKRESSIRPKQISVEDVMEVFDNYFEKVSDNKWRPTYQNARNSYQSERGLIQEIASFYFPERFTPDKQGVNKVTEFQNLFKL